MAEERGGLTVWLCPNGHGQVQFVVMHPPRCPDCGEKADHMLVEPRSELDTERRRADQALAQLEALRKAVASHLEHDWLTCDDDKRLVAATEERS